MQYNPCFDRYNTIGRLVLSSFFSRPKLRIDREVITPQLQLLGPQDEPLGITRKWLKIRITNGGALATNCRAELNTLPVQGLKYPTDSKRLIWDDGSEEKSIRAKDLRGELLRVAFFDSYFPIGYVHAMVCTKEAEKSPNSRAQDGFEAGDFDVTIDIRSDDGRAFVSEKFRIHTGKDMNDFSMRAI